MGGRMSHELLDATKDDSVNSDDQCLTPCKRMLEFDPRSPSIGIDRTPILVEKTPPTDAFIDPRSPTPGILRTPISNNVQSKLTQGSAAVKTLAVPAPLAFPEDTGDNLGMDLGKDDSAQGDTTELLGLQRLSLLEDSPPNCESSQLIPGDAEMHISSGTVTMATSKPGKKSAPKPLISKRERSLIAKENGSETRSPLRSRNPLTDSPRNIIQRKQMSSLDTKMSYRAVHCQKNTPPSADKENVRKIRM